MNTRERIVVYGLLTTLAVSNAFLLLATTGRPATAEPLGETLGPADSLVLAGAADDTDDVELINRDGRLAWGDDVHERAYSVAYVFIGGILNQLMGAEARVEERLALIDELEGEEKEFRERIEEIRQRGMEMDEESDDFRRTYEEYIAAGEELRAWQAQAITRRGQLDAVHLEDAYREMIDAVQVVADRQKIDTVYRFIPTDDPFNADNPDQALLAIRLRTALRYPDELDITDAVLEELSLDLE